MMLCASDGVMTVRICTLFASPRPGGNTAALASEFADEARVLGHEVETLSLYDMRLEPCVACRACQRDWGSFACARSDDMARVAESVMASELIVLASPIYSWYCTPPMKCALDRLVYGLNKYYGERRGPSLWAGRAVAIITTCGYRPENGADLWEAGVRRYAKHSRLRYVGMLAERHLGYDTTFMDDGKAARAREFARRACAEAQSSAGIS